MPAIVIYIAVAMLFVAVAPLPYGYYTLLRLVATGVFVWAVFVSYERKCQYLPWGYALLALLFNPIIKVHLPKELWACIDIGAAVFLLLTKKYVQQTGNEKRPEDLH